MLVQIRQYYIFQPLSTALRVETSELELYGHGRSTRSRPRPVPTSVYLRPCNPPDPIEGLKVATFPCCLVEREESRRGRCGPEVLRAGAVSYTEKRGCGSGHRAQGQCRRPQVRPSVAEGGSRGVGRGREVSAVGVCCQGLMG